MVEAIHHFVDFLCVAKKLSVQTSRNSLPPAILGTLERPTCMIVNRKLQAALERAESLLTHRVCFDGCLLGALSTRGVPVKQRCKIITELPSLALALDAYQCDGLHAHAEDRGESLMTLRARSETLAEIVFQILLGLDETQMGQCVHSISPLCCSDLDDGKRCEDEPEPVIPVEVSEDQAEADADPSDVEVKRAPQENKKLRIPRKVALPTEAERERHMLTHIPFQSWCATCVAARGKQQWRRRRKPKIQDTESDKSGIPLTEIDYIFVGSMDGQGVATIFSSCGS